MIKIEAPTWEDFEDVELPRLPVVGATIETKYGTCVVTQADSSVRQRAVPGQDRLPSALAGAATAQVDVGGPPLVVTGGPPVMPFAWIYEMS